MSKIIASAAIRGAHKIVGQAEEMFERARSEKGEDTKIEFPDTAFYFPMANALTGAKVETVGQIKPILDHAKELLPEVPGDRLWLPYLGGVLDAGVATLFAEEIIVAVRYLFGEEPQPDCEGFFTDTIMRSLGIQLVDGRMPGFAAILGAAPDNETAVNIIRELQQRNILCFVGSSTNGRSIVDQLMEADIEMGWDNYIVPYGRDTITAIYAANWAIRSALTFGGIEPGLGQKCLLYTKARVFAFGITLGEVDDEKYATGAGCIAMGFPIIADTEIPEILPSGICTYEHVVRELDHSQIVPRAIEVRGVKVKVEEIPIPVRFAAAFEGERIRREDMHVEFGGKYSTAFEYLRTRPMDEVVDGKIELVGPDADSVEVGAAMPLGILVEVAGRKMQADFEPILERQIHSYMNHAQGIFHMGQRDLVWIRIGKEAFAAGFRIKHLGEMLHAKLLDDYGMIVDKVQVTLYTNQEDVDRLLPEARKIFTERDERISGMTDEGVDIFYSCTLCQSFAPNHVCVVSPERPGLCGAYSWLDARASYEINPNGPNQPVPKGKVIDERLGQWENVNQFVFEHSNRTVERFSAYSLMVDPMTSCGCFECIMAALLEANGVMVVNREYSGMTPAGMKFSTLAGTVGGGAQTPGFLGIGRLFVVSKKFISADGGIKRLVWMPKELKEAMGEKIKARGEEIGIPDFLDMIADETVVTEMDQLLPFLEKVGHPALSMDPIF